MPGAVMPIDLSLPEPVSGQALPSISVPSDLLMSLWDSERQGAGIPGKRAPLVHIPVPSFLSFYHWQNAHFSPISRKAKELGAVLWGSGPGCQVLSRIPQSHLGGWEPAHRTVPAALGKSMTTPSLCSCMEAKKKEECGCQKTTALGSSYLLKVARAMGTSLHSVHDLEKAPDFQASK